MCPLCNGKLIWQSDFMCDEVRGCPCEEGVVSIWVCSECDAFIEVSTGCKENER